MAQDKELIKKCLKEIEFKIGWTDSVNWQQKQFEKLSEIILEKTKICISPVTLKRLWGKVNYNSHPSITTLDALTSFIGYNNWMEFTLRNKNKKTFTVRNIWSNYRKTILILGSFVVFAFFILFTIFNSASTSVNNNSHLFSVLKLSEGLPNTAQFKYNVQHTNAKSVMIQQSWDSRFRFVVDKEKTEFSCLYYFPGYFKAKLIIDDSIVAEQAILIKTEGIQGIIHKKPIPSYINTEQLISNDGLEITVAHLLEAGFDLNNYIPTTTINLVGGFEGIQGNNFSIEADIRHTYPRENAICQKCEVILMCTNGNIRVPVSIKACVNDLKVVILDKTIKSEDHDLSVFGTNFSDFVHIKVAVEEGYFSASVNNNRPFIDTLTVNPGNVVGINFRFEGTGKVKSFQLKSEDASYVMTDFLP